jgi:hypothetical protein
MRVENNYSRVQKLTNPFVMNYLYLRNIPAKLSRATPIEFGSPHEAICAGFFDICLPTLHSY